VLESKAQDINQPTSPPDSANLQEQLEESSRDFINSLGRVADFFGFNRLMGQLYAALFLSPEPLTLDDMVKRLDSSKGNVSINIRSLERWGLVRQIYKWADRKNYYEAETDIWTAISGILQERERRENSQILRSLTHSIEALEKVSAVASGQEAQVADFYLMRMEMLRKLLQFGDHLLEKMVKGGQVNFATARHSSKIVDANKNGFAEPEIEVLETEVE